MKIILLAIFSLTMFGCASTSQIVKFQHEKELHSGSARIYILRPSILGSAFRMKVYANDKFIGKTGPKGYLCWDVTEGEYILKTSAENVDLFTVNAKAGKTYYIKQKYKQGILSVRSSLELLEEKEGRAIVSKLKQPTVKYTE